MHQGFPVFDLDRTELLRGPQGTLFGRNTPAGVVKFDSRRPTQDAEGYAQVSYGTLRQPNFEGAYRRRLERSLSLRVSALYQSRDDWVDNTFTGEDDALEGYDDFAASACSCCGRVGRLQRAAQRARADLDGTARLFRANIIRPAAMTWWPASTATEVSRTASTTSNSTPPAPARA
jgi:iron complex outermembrane receptor protein